MRRFRTNVTVPRTFFQILVIVAAVQLVAQDNPKDLTGSWAMAFWTYQTGQSVYKHLVLNRDSTFTYSSDEAGDCSNNICWDAFYYSTPGKWTASGDTIYLSADTISGGAMASYFGFQAIHYTLRLPDTLELDTTDPYGGIFYRQEVTKALYPCLRDGAISIATDERGCSVVFDILGRSTRQDDFLSIRKSSLAITYRRHGAHRK